MTPSNQLETVRFFNYKRSFVNNGSCIADVFYLHWISKIVCQKWWNIFWCRSFFEPIVLYVRDEIAIPNIGQKHYKRYMSFLLTVFFFIWFLNIFGLTPLGINVTGNIAVTAGLAIVTFIITTLTANKNYWGHIFWMPGVPVPMKFILAPIELLGIFIKPFALMIRLYANMIAGHIVIMSLLALIFIYQNIGMGALSFTLTFIISIIEILVAALQAYIFTMLAALYFGSAVEEHHHEEAHH